MNSRRKLLLIICAALTMTVAVAEAAQYPTRPIRLIVASAPGGNPDINSRNLANELSKQIGQQVVVENRPGASGIIGYEALARATPDGYALGYLSNLIATNPSLYEKLPYDFARDFQPLLLYLTGLNVLTVAPAAGAIGERADRICTRRSRQAVLWDVRHRGEYPPVDGIIQNHDRHQHRSRGLQGYATGNYRLDRRSDLKRCATTWYRCCRWCEPAGCAGSGLPRLSDHLYFPICQRSMRRGFPATN